MRAWHGQPGLREQARSLVEDTADDGAWGPGDYQRRAPQRSTGWERCAIGAMLPRLDDTHDSSAWWHHQLGEYYGIPLGVAALIDAIFEGLAARDLPAAVQFTRQIVDAIPVGADLAPVPARLVHDLLTHEQWGAMRLTAGAGPHHDLVDQVAVLYARAAAGEDVTQPEWLAAYRAADKATRAPNDLPPFAQRGVQFARDAAWLRVEDKPVTVTTCGAIQVALDAWGTANHGFDVPHWPWLAERLLHHLSHAPEGAR